MRLHFSLLTFILLFSGLCVIDSPSRAFESSSKIDSIPSASFVADSDITVLVDELNSLVEIYNQKSRPISLFEALKKTLEFNPNLLAFRQQILAQYYQFKDYQSAWNPTISAYSASTPFFGNSYITGSSGTTSTTKYNPSRDSLNNQTNSESSSSTLTQFAPGVSLTWTFFDLSRQSLIESGFYALKQQQYLYAATVRDQFLSVQQSYYNLQGSSLIIQYYFPLYENLIKQYSILKEQFASGLIDIVTLSQTRSQLYLTLNQLIGYYNSLFDSSSNLSRNIGVSPDILFTPDSKLARTGDWNLSLQNSLISAEKSREEISAAMSAVKSSNQFSRYYIAQYLPTFSLYGSYSVNNNWGNSSSKNYYNKDSPAEYTSNTSTPYSYNTRSIASIGLSFSWSIFDGGSNYFKSKRQDALAYQNLANADGQKLLVSQQVRSAFSIYKTSDLQEQLASNAFKSAQTASDASLYRFNAGVSDITTYIQTIQLFTSAASSYVQALTDYNNSVAQLYRYTSVFPENIADLDEDSLFFVSP